MEKEQIAERLKDIVEEYKDGRITGYGMFSLVNRLYEDITEGAKEFRKVV